MDQLLTIISCLSCLAAIISAICAIKSAAEAEKARLNAEETSRIRSEREFFTLGEHIMSAFNENKALIQNYASSVQSLASMAGRMKSGMTEFHAEKAKEYSLRNETEKKEAGICLNYNMNSHCNDELQRRIKSLAAIREKMLGLKIEITLALKPFEEQLREHRQKILKL